MVRRDPREWGQAGARWRLEDIQRVCDWLRLGTAGGLSRLLGRLGISYQRGRQHVHSPDPDYLGKLLDIQGFLRQALEAPDLYVVLFQDEFSYYRQPSLERAYEARGQAQPLAELGHCKNRRGRILSVLNALTGAVYAEQHAYTGVSEMTTFYQQVCQRYPQAKLIYLVQDNWPVHFHPELLAALQPQVQRWPYHVPESWPAKPKRPVEPLHLPIQLVLLPTYASWANPIEKLWRMLRQEVLHLHRFQDDWPGLQQRVADFLQQFSEGSERLLRYVGLSDPQRLYAPAFSANQSSLPLRC